MKCFFLRPGHILPSIGLRQSVMAYFTILTLKGPQFQISKELQRSLSQICDSGPVRVKLSNVPITNLHSHPVNN